ncbi:unnamed protein product [Lactuca virosa]|uniref:Uncharacterized protein n=1 Tax=Lactuca virosa TaxID=75947 RepID=A0AAU9P373_9ASTR|nr:unnamed protein product [Lactuca virosa]
MNGGYCGIVVFKGIFFTNGGVWKTIGCSLAIWCNIGVCEITDMLLMLSIVGGVVLLEITVSYGICVEELCAITAVEEIGSSVVGLHNSFVGAVVIVGSSCCDAPPVTGVRSGVITGSNDIIYLMGLVGIPPAPPMSLDAIFEC